MIDKVNIWQALAAGSVVLLVIFRKAIGRFLGKTMDQNNDGKVEYLEWVRIPYLLLAGFVIVREGLVEAELFSDVKFIVVVLASLGVEFLMVWLKRIDIKKRDSRPYSESEIPPP